MSDEPCEEVLALVGPVITNQTGKVPGYDVVLRYSHAFAARPNAKSQQRSILFRRVRSAARRRAASHANGNGIMHLHWLASRNATRRNATQRDATRRDATRRDATRRDARRWKGGLSLRLTSGGILRLTSGGILRFTSDGILRSWTLLANAVYVGFTKPSNVCVNSIGNSRGCDLHGYAENVIDNV